MTNMRTISRLVILQEIEIIHSIRCMRQFAIKYDQSMVGESFQFRFIAMTTLIRVIHLFKSQQCIVGETIIIQGCLLTT